MKRAGVAAIFLFVLSLGSVAHAEDGAPVAPPRVAPPTLAVGMNPLALMAGRGSFDALYLPLPQLALVASGHYLHSVERYGASRLASSGAIFPAIDTHDRGFGGELGVRYYFPWRRGSYVASAAFLGVSMLYGQYTYSAGASSTDYSALGVAFDAGVTFSFGGVFVMSVGGGLQGTSNSRSVDMDIHRPTDGVEIDWPSSQTILNGGGVRPRLLLTLGFGH